jgi:uncharacterized membrane protein YebE (DUF533 family)
MAAGMARAKLLIGSAAATAALGVRVARSLYARWRSLPDPDRRRIEPLAEDLKARALAARGAPDRESAGHDLRAASETFAAALVETAEADPAIDAEEVRALREDLRRELERLERASGADIKASRTGRGPTVPPG